METLRKYEHNTASSSVFSDIVGREVEAFLSSSDHEVEEGCSAVCRKRRRYIKDHEINRIVWAGPLESSNPASCHEQRQLLDNVAQSPIQTNPE